MRPLRRSTIRLQLANPGSSSIWGMMHAERAEDVVQVARVGVPPDDPLRAPSPVSCIRCITAISHSATAGISPKIWAALSRLARMPSSLACIASSVRHAVVTMQRPESRSASIDSPMQPSIPSRGA